MFVVWYVVCFSLVFVPREVLAKLFPGLVTISTLNLSLDFLFWKLLTSSSTNVAALVNVSLSPVLWAILSSFLPLAGVTSFRIQKGSNNERRRPFFFLCVCGLKPEFGGVEQGITFPLFPDLNQKWRPPCSVCGVPALLSETAWAVGFALSRGLITSGCNALPFRGKTEAIEGGYLTRMGPQGPLILSMANLSKKQWTSTDLTPKPCVKTWGLFALIQLLLVSSVVPCKGRRIPKPILVRWDSTTLTRELFLAPY